MLKYIINSYKAANSLQTGHTGVISIGVIGAVLSTVLTAAQFIVFEVNYGILRATLVAAIMATVPVIWNFMRDKD